MTKQYVQVSDETTGFFHSFSVAKLNSLGYDWTVERTVAMAKTAFPTATVVVAIFNR